MLILNLVNLSSVAYYCTLVVGLNLLSKRLKGWLNLDGQSVPSPTSLLPVKSRVGR